MWPNTTSAVFGTRLRIAGSLSLLATAINAAGLAGTILDMPAVQGADSLARMFVENTSVCILIVLLPHRLTARTRCARAGWRRCSQAVPPVALLAIVYYTGFPFTTPGLKYGYTASPTALLLYMMWQSLALVSRPAHG